MEYGRRELKKEIKVFKVLVLYLRRIEIMANFRLLEKYKLSVFVKILRKIITKMYLPASGGGKKRDKINVISSIEGRKVG